MRVVLIVLSLFFVYSCTHYEQDKKIVVEQAKKDSQTVKDNVTRNAVRIANNVRDGVKMTNERVRQWWLTPLPSTDKQLTPTSYCYKVLQDILCYREQMLGWENRLVGYQGANADPAIPAQMRSLALREENKSALPEKKVADLKPVFVSTPVDPKESKTTDPNATNNINIDSASENIADSPLSPQL